jgi:hypothetical protein
MIPPLAIAVFVIWSAHIHTNTQNKSGCHTTRIAFAVHDEAEEGLDGRETVVKY